MSIKTKHFQKKTSYSNSGKKKLLAALGLAASLGVSGCEKETTTSGMIVDPAESSSSITDEPLAGEIQIPESSSSISHEPTAGVIMDPEISSSSNE